MYAGIRPRVVDSLSSQGTPAPPLVSVVSPCFNQGRYVSQMIKSMRHQTMPRWELIVVDDGSTDGSSKHAVAAAEGDPRVRVERTDNRGAPAARNHGVAHASDGSSYFLFLDADDELEPQMLERVTDCLESEPRFGMAHCRVTYMDATGRPLPGTPGFLPRYVRRGFGIRELRDDEVETPFCSILALTGMIPSTVLIRRAVFDASGGWDDAFGQPCEDTDLFLRLALEAPVRFMPQALVRHRRHAEQSTSSLSGYEAQLAKLQSRWRQTHRWCEGKASVVRDAWRFHDRQLTWARARMAARRLAAEGHPLAALRFLGGAVRITGRSLLKPTQ